MIVAWPVEKRHKFLALSEVLITDAAKKGRSTPHSVSRVLGLIRHAAPVAPMGIFRSLRLQHLFNDVAATAPCQGTGEQQHWNLVHMFGEVGCAAHHPFVALALSGG
jgi:hypothetical protein